MNEITEEIRLFESPFEYSFLPALDHLLHIHSQLFEGVTSVPPFLVELQNPIWKDGAPDKIPDCHLQGVFE